MKTLTDETILKAEYPDGIGNHELTVKQFKDRFEEEDPLWTLGMLKSLEERGFANTRFSKYSIVELVEPTDPEIGHYEYLRDSDQLKSFDIK